jgi:DNA replication protein DnaC
MDPRIARIAEVWKSTGADVNENHVKAVEWMIKVTDMLNDTGRSRFVRIPNLYIYGPTGTGKSTLLWMIYNTFRKNLDVPVVAPEGRGYWNMRDIIQETKDSWNSDGKFLRKAMDRQAILLLDDVGAERYTDFNVDMIDEIFNYRELCGWPTVVTSNLSPGNLRVRYGSDRFNSRFFGSCDELHMDGSDRRRV